MNERARDIKALVGASLSPDGRTAALVIQASTAEGGRTNIWLSRTDGAGVRQVTYSVSDAEPGEQSPDWSPDGAFLYFRAKRGASTQLMRLPLAGGEAQGLTLARSVKGALVSGWIRKDDDAVATSVSDYAPSPDGRWLAVIARDGETAARAADVKKKLDAVEVGVDDVPRERLYIVSAAGGEATEIDLPDQARSVRWSPASDEIAAVSSPADDDLGPANKVWRVNVSNSKASPISGLPATTRELFWTKTGFAFLAQCADDTPPGCSDVYVWDAAGQRVRNLTHGLAGSVGALNGVTADAESVIATLKIGVRSQLARIDLATGVRTVLEAPLPVVSSAVSNLSGTGWVLLAQGPTTPLCAWFAPAVWARSSDAFASGRGTLLKLAMPLTAPKDWPFANSRVLRWRNGGLSIEGLVYLPKLAPGARAPLVVMAHGGPAGVFQDRASVLVSLLTAEGWAVLAPNPRGSEGYGTAFLAANHDDLGGRDYADIMAGVDAALAAFPLDASRMALIGYSYGGEMAGFVEGRTDRFKALVAGAPVIDQFSEYGVEDSSFYDRWYYGKPWEHVASAWRQSPLARVGFGKTPLLLLQGEADPTDPPGQSLEMRRAMTQAGTPVVLVTYPRETHASLGRAYSGDPTAEPWHGVDLRRRMIQFIADAFAAKPATASSGR